MAMSIKEFIDKRLAIVEWTWRGYRYQLARALPWGKYPFVIYKWITEAEALRRAQPEIDARIREKREAATRYFRDLHGIPERRP
jgi:hypothetical protein